MRTLLYVLIALSAATAAAQTSSPDVPPQVEVVTDADTYPRLAPVLATVVVTNPALTTQNYGPISPFWNFRYVIVGPQGKMLLPYEAYGGSVYAEMAAPWTPGETRRSTINALLLYPATVEEGVHIFKAWFESPTGLVSDTASVAYAVAPANSSAMDALAQALRAVWSGGPWSPQPAVDPDILLSQALNSGSLPPYAEELAEYLRAVSADIRAAAVGSFAVQAEADQLYEAFLDTYPSSVYAPAARAGSFSLAVSTPIDPVDPFESLTGAITAAGLVSPSFNGTAFVVSGVPTSLSGAPDPEADPVRGIATLDEAASAAVLGALSSRQAPSVTGVGSAPDVAVAELPFDAAAFAGDLVALATVTLDARPSGPVGTEAAPVVAYAPSGARLSGGFRGAGVLVVDGEFEMRGDAEWLGLVVVRGSSDQQADPTLSGAPRILGALLVLPGEGGGAAALRLSGQVSVLYSPEALALAAAAAAQ